MKTRERIVDAPLEAGVYPQVPLAADVVWRRAHRLDILRSPLWLCLLVALVVRIWLVVHTQGFVDGDEAMLGIQAQHILHGERPIYYYGQPYMGSLESYLLAGLFALFGSSVWILRALTVLLSLVLVYMSWRLAGALSDSAKLSVSVRRWFMTVTGLLAALPPLYDIVIELRTWGGHIEIYILMLWLLYSIVRLTRRWDAGATGREIGLRWAGIGLIVGAGIWIYPLISCAVLAAMLWLAVFLVRRMLPGFQHVVGIPFQPRAMHWRNLLLVVLAIPACLLGFAPGIYWGAQHRWANVLYLFSPGSDGGNAAWFVQSHPNRLAVVAGTMQLYARCLVPEVMGGSLPSATLAPTSTYSFWLLTGLSVAALLTVAVLVVSFFFRRSAMLFSLQRLAALPLLFAVCTIFIFCCSSVVGGSITQPCTRDGVGRYAAPILLSLPFVGASLFTLAVSYFQQKRYTVVESSAENALHMPMDNLLPALPALPGLRGLLLLLVLYLGVVGNTYIKSNPAYVFQSFTCLVAPLDNQPIIDYMQREHIHRVWGTISFGNSITFKTNSDVIVVDPRIFTSGGLDRLPANANAVKNADRASVLDMVPHSERHPALLTALDQAHVQYRVARFATQPGAMDVLVVTPLNRTLTPAEAAPIGSETLRC